jgi:hypothetical protein
MLRLLYLHSLMRCSQILRSVKPPDFHISQYSPYELWYISRNRDSSLTSQDQTYTLRSMACPLYLDQSDPDARQRVSGLACWATAKQALYHTQQWTLSQQDAFSVVIQSYFTGCVLDVECEFMSGILFFSDSTYYPEQLQTSCVLLC